MIFRGYLAGQALLPRRLLEVTVSPGPKVQGSGHSPTIGRTVIALSKDGDGENGVAVPAGWQDWRRAAGSGIGCGDA